MLTIHQSISILDRSERGRDVARSLHDFLTGRAAALDMDGKTAVLSLIEEAFINRPGSVAEALSRFAPELAERPAQARHGCLTVGDIRRATEGLPDQTRVLPDWGNFEPADSDPCVRIDGIQICPPTAGRDGEIYLSVLVALEPLDSGEEDEEGEDTEDGPRPFDELIRIIRRVDGDNENDGDK